MNDVLEKTKVAIPEEKNELVFDEPDFSGTIGKLAEALSKTQGELKEAVRDSNNPFFKSKYADLTSVWEACRSQLSKNGLAVVQTMADNGSERVVIVTTLIHSSGEWIRGRLSVKPVKNDPQGIGSAITYARRYSLAAIVGVARMMMQKRQWAGKRKLQRNPQSSHQKKESSPLECTII